MPKRLTFYRYRHKFADRVNDWEYDTGYIASDAEWEKYYLRDMAHFLEDDFDWSELYRGVDMERVDIVDVPIAWFDESIARHQRLGRDNLQRAKLMQEYLKDRVEKGLAKQEAENDIY